MNKYEIKTTPLEQLRNQYKMYLQERGLRRSTVSTSMNGAFYLWAKSGADVFWSSILSENFEVDYRKAMISALKKNSKVEPNDAINGYMYHGRNLRKFLLNEISHVEEVNSLAVKSNTNTKMQTLIRVPKPTNEEVDKYLERWSTLENYYFQERALDKLFLTLCPDNTDIADILIKVSTLNDFYSTNIFSVYPVARHILLMDIDARLKRGDTTLIGDIQKININGEEKNFYSFATKYCSHHNSVDFPIYDSYVEKVLKYFRGKDGFSKFENKELKDYTKFKSVLIDFKKFYGLEKYNLKEIDRYIWQIGKEYFPKRYKKRRR